MAQSDMTQEEAIRHAARLLLAAHYATALTGAGISVESGIPPFRGPGGLWTKYGEPPMNGYERFLENPKRAWEERLSPTGPGAILRETVAAAVPNPGHYACVGLEEMGLLQCLITQNIDNLHRRAGSCKLAEIHGNSTLVRCIRCTLRVPFDDISLELLPPPCPNPTCQGILKIDTVAFGEPIPSDVLEQCRQAAERSDCMLVAGTSAIVYPAAWFPLQVRENGGTLIEVNLYESELTPLCAVSLRGKSGELLPQIVNAAQELRSAQAM
jgi:NAD-dependent deacetylase